jgi:hypothetical protein
MAERVPTQRGDVLILRTDHSFTLHVVGLVTKDGQQDFDTHLHLKYECNRDIAVADARGLGLPGRRIFFRNLDTGDWSEIRAELE